jgi:hypothetical protein
LTFSVPPSRRRAKPASTSSSELKPYASQDVPAFDGVADFSPARYCLKHVDVDPPAGEVPPAEVVLAIGRIEVPCRGQGF